MKFPSKPLKAWKNGSPPSIVSDCSETASEFSEHSSTSSASSPIMPLDPKNYVAMDCEMVGVGPMRFSVLARVSIVDFHGEAILDTFVRVEEKVTDYRTHVSGIRPADLKSDQARSFGECRQEVMAAIEGKILVGHALENDLKILNIHHPWELIRDTATYGPFMRVGQHDGIWKARRLVELTRTFLGVNIQQNEHCSMEDAKAAMQLYRAVQHEWDYAVEVEWEQRRAAMMYQQSMYATRPVSGRYDWRYAGSASLGV